MIGDPSPLDLQYWAMAQRQRWTREQLDEVRIAVRDLSTSTPWTHADIVANLENFVGVDWSLDEIMAALTSRLAFRGATVAYRFRDQLHADFGVQRAPISVINIALHGIYPVNNDG